MYRIIISILLVFAILFIVFRINDDKTTPRYLVEMNEPTQYFGLNLSSKYLNINWDDLKNNNNINFIYIEATEGSIYIDPQYSSNLSQAHRHNYRIGSVLTFKISDNVKRQVDLFTSVAKKSQQDYVPMINLEKTLIYTPTTIRDSLIECIRLLREHYGKEPILEFNERIAKLDIINDYSALCPIYWNNDAYISDDSPLTEHISLRLLTNSAYLQGIPRRADLLQITSKKNLEAITL